MNKSALRPSPVMRRGRPREGEERSVLSPPPGNVTTTLRPESLSKTRRPPEGSSQRNIGKTGVAPPDPSQRAAPDLTAAGKEAGAITCTDKYAVHILLCGVVSRFMKQGEGNIILMTSFRSNIVSQMKFNTGKALACKAGITVPPTRTYTSLWVQYREGCSG